MSLKRPSKEQPESFEFYYSYFNTQSKRYSTLTDFAKLRG